MAKFVNYRKRSVTLPPGCKNLIDVLQPHAPPFPTAKSEYVIDGAEFSSLAEAGTHFTRVLGFTQAWNGKLWHLSVLLDASFGTPDEGFIVVWRYSHLSRERLGYAATIDWYEEELRTGHASNLPGVRHGLAEARANKGRTVFDWLVEIFHTHERIELRLE